MEFVNGTSRIARAAQRTEGAAPIWLRETGELTVWSGSGYCVAPNTGKPAIYCRLPVLRRFCDRYHDALQIPLAMPFQLELSW
jgi:hypothetical protein